MTLGHDISTPFGLISLALFITAALYALLGIHALRQRTQGATASYLAWMMLAMAWWSASYGMEVHVPELSAKIFWVKIEYPGVVAIPIFWLFFVLEYIGQSALLTRRNKALAALLPLLTVLLMWTNEFHGLIYSELHIAKTGDLTLLDADHGLFFWVFFVNFYLLLGVGSLLLLIHTFRSTSLFRAQAVMILLATFSPWIGNAISVAKLIPIPGLDITPFAFIPTGIMLTWAIARYHLLDIVPPQQNIILQSLRDGVIVLDARRRVLYMNRAAEQILSQNADRSLGKPAETVCGVCSPMILPLLAKEEQSIELALNDKGELRHYEIRVSPNYLTEKERRLGTPAWLIVFHDITSSKLIQATLYRREAILRAVSLASEQFLKSASWEKNIQTVLEQIGSAANASRVYIFESRISDDNIALISQKYEWVAEGIQPNIDNPNRQNLPWREAGFQRWADELTQHRVVSGPVGEFPVAERELLQPQGILSLAIIPIFIDETFWGFIGFDDCLVERQWSESELDALRAAAGIFGAALERRNIELRLIKRQHSQTLLQEIIRAALGKSDINEMAQFLVDHLGSLIGADHCFLSRWDEVREQVIPVASYGIPLDEYQRMIIQPGEKSLTTSALEAGHMLVVDDAQDSPFVSLRIAQLFHTRSVLVIPMISNEKKLGAVLLGFSNPHRFIPDEIILSEQAAELVTLAFAKIRAVDEARRRADEAETLRRAGAAISETLNLQEATTRILEQLAFVLPHDSASIQLLRGNELEIIGGEGWTDPNSIVGVRFPIPANNPNTVVIQTCKPYLLNDVHEAFPEFRHIVHASHIRSWLGVPLIVHNQVIGLLAIDSRETSHFTADDAELATAFAGHVAVAIENTRLFNEVQQLAITDGLTGLYNRRYFMELAQNEFERSRRYKRRLSVMMFDIDHFKIVNDTYGHPFGDKVLQAIAKLCKEKLREVDSLSRYGGEEFIALIVETSLVSAKKVAERLRTEVEKLVTHHAKADVRVTISIGLAEQNENTPTLETLIARADQAMYVSKHKGRNRVSVGR